MNTGASSDTSKTQELLEKADEQYRSGKIWRAIRGYKKVLKLEPRHVTALVNLGLIYYANKGKREKARELIERAREIAPDNPSVLFNLATLKASSGELDEAWRLLEQVESHNPKLPDLHCNKAHLLVQQERYEEALREVEIELSNNPGNMNAQLMKQVLVERVKKG